MIGSPGGVARTIGLRVRKNAKPGTSEGLAYIIVKMLAVPLEGQNQVRLANPNHKVERKCIMAGCHKTLSADEWDLLKQVPNLNRNKMVYCFEHLPDHYKRKIPEQYLKAFLRE